MTRGQTRSLLSIVPLNRPVLISRCDTGNRHHHLSGTSTLFEGTFIRYRDGTSRCRDGTTNINHGKVSSSSPSTLFGLLHGLRNYVGSRIGVGTTGGTVHGCGGSRLRRLSTLVSLEFARDRTGRLLTKSFYKHVKFPSCTLDGGGTRVGQLRDHVGRLRSIGSMAKTRHRRCSSFSVGVSPRSGHVLFCFPNGPRTGVHSLLGSHTFG